MHVNAPQLIPPTAYEGQNFGAHWVAPYAKLSGTASPNFVWQDTTSNATYCSASAALSSVKQP